MIAREGVLGIENDLAATVARDDLSVSGNDAVINLTGIRVGGGKLKRGILPLAGTAGTQNYVQAVCKSSIHADSAYC